MTVLVSEVGEKWQRMIEELCMENVKVGLKLNMNKTKVMLSGSFQSKQIQTLYPHIWDCLLGQIVTYLQQVEQYPVHVCVLVQEIKPLLLHLTSWDSMLTGIQ